MGLSSGAGLHPLPTGLPFPKGLQPSPGARFPLGAAEPAGPCSLRWEAASLELALHGHPSEEEREPSWEEAGAGQQG